MDCIVYYNILQYITVYIYIMIYVSSTYFGIRCIRGWYLEASISRPLFQVPACSGETQSILGRRGSERGLVENRPIGYAQNFMFSHSYGHLLVITGYFYGIIHSINGVFLVLITGISGLNCTFSPNFRFSMENLGFVYLIFRHSHFAFTDCQLACQQGLPGRVAAVLWLQSQRKSRNSNAIEKTSGFVHILGCKI